jgi:hypothetical protein
MYVCMYKTRFDEHLILLNKSFMYISSIDVLFNACIVSVTLKRRTYIHWLVFVLCFLNIHM